MMNRTTLSLLVVLTVVANLNLGAAAGSGNGYYEDNLLTPHTVPTTPWPLQCRVPVYSDPSRIRAYPPSITLTVENNGVVAVEGRCYLACVPSFLKTVSHVIIYKFILTVRHACIGSNTLKYYEYSLINLNAACKWQTSSGLGYALSKGPARVVLVLH